MRGEKMDAEKRHLNWVDGARVLAILSVILQHVPAPCVWNAPVLTSSLALFFILSGYFLSARLVQDGKTRWNYVRRRLLAFVKPYIVWNLIFTAGDIAMKLDDPAWLRGDWHDPLGLIMECFGLGHAPALVPLWFLRDLMIFVVIAALLLPKFKNAFVLLAVACLFIGSAPDAEAWPKPYMFGNFGLGILLARVLPQVGRWGSLPLRFHAGLAALFALFCALMPLLPSLGGSSFIYEPITPLGVLALLSAGVLWSATKVGKSLPLLGKSVFFIYCFHTVPIVLLMGLARETEAWPFWIWWSLVPFIAAASFGVYRILSLKFPRLLGWLSC